MQKIKICFVSLVLMLILAYSAFAQADGQLDFEIDFEKNILYLNYNTQKEGSIRLSAKFLSRQEYYISADIKRFKAGQLEITAELNGKGRLAVDTQGEEIFAGNIKSSMLFVNHKPINEFNLNYRLGKDSFRVDSFYWNGVSAAGAIGLRPPYNLDSVISIAELDLNSLTRMLGLSSHGQFIFDLDRIMKADIKISGPLRMLNANAKILAEDTETQADIRRVAYLNLQGTLPYLKLVDSHVVENTGVEYTIEGRLDFAKRPDETKTNDTQVALANDKAFRFEDWVISRGSVDKDKDSMELRYRLNNDNYLKMDVKDGENTTIVWEKNIKF